MRQDAAVMQVICDNSGMLSSLMRMLDSKLGGAGDQSQSREAALQLATAALLVEMSRADFGESGLELGEASQMLLRHFTLSQAEVRALLESARAEVDHSVSLFKFTSMLNGYLNEDDKATVIEMLWRVAFADGRLDKYEDALMHKISDLLYVPHAKLMQMKFKAQDVSGEPLICNNTNKKTD